MPLLSVYNHFIQSYAMMRQSRFDTHKKSELRDIYTRIAKMTSEQPLYKVSFDDVAQEFTLGLKGSALSLASVLKELHTHDSSSVFKECVLVSDHPEEVSVSLPEGAGSDVAADPLCIQVSRLSSPQKNTGAFVTSEAAELPAGQYTFTAGVDGNLYSFQFNVSEGSKNLELLTKLSDFINKTAIGLTTTVRQQPDLGLSRLELTAVQPGSSVSGEPSFTLTDTKRPEGAEKGIIAHFDLNHILSLPGNTEYTVNGVPRSVRGTKDIPDRAMTLSFHAATGQPVQIFAQTDSTPVVKKTAEFIRRYNETVSLIRSNPSAGQGARRLLAELTRMTAQYADSLSSCGIRTAPDGSLSSETEVLTHAAADGTLEQLFTSENGFVSAVLGKCSEISLNPMEYLNKTIVTYPNTLAKKTFNPYITSIYSGLLYNNYC